MRWFLPLPLILLLHVNGHTSEFNYKETDKWGGECQTGKRQSPIDLSNKFAGYERVDPMYFIRYDEPIHFEVQNNGHSIKLKLDQQCSSSYGIAGGRLYDVYLLDHIHFHWRAEHLVDGKRMPLEAHFVHYRRDYKTVEEAMTKPAGLAVLGVLFQESDSENKVLRELLPYFGNYSTNWETPKYHLTPGSLLPKQKNNFFRYDGSLTTPPCSETVVWTVFRDTLPISKAQIEQLSTVYFKSDPENYRPVQKLNKRKLTIMTYDDKKPPMNCAKPSKAERTLCLLLTLTGALPVLRK